jgi:hypothetical protein
VEHDAERPIPRPAAGLLLRKPGDRDPLAPVEVVIAARFELLRELAFERLLEQPDHAALPLDVEQDDPRPAVAGLCRLDAAVGAEDGARSRRALPVRTALLAREMAITSSMPLRYSVDRPVPSIL